MAPDLPYELHELICGYLDAATLTTYSMTCHQFHSIAQKYIFSKVKLIFPRPTGINNSRTEGLLRLSAGSPQIGELVETVSLVDRRHLPFNFMITYLWDDPILSSLLSRLQNVKNFSMESSALSSLAWVSMSLMLQDTLIGMFYSNALTCLALYRVVELPLDVLDGCTALQDLSLELVTFVKQDMDAFTSISRTTSTQRERRARLKSLRLTLSDPLFHFFSTWITTPVCSLDITNLQRLAASMTMEYYDHGNVNRILQACAKTLEVFCFSPTFQSNPDAEHIAINPIDISILSSLRILRLRIGVLTLSLRRLRVHTPQNYFPWIFNLLNQIPPSNSVTEISIKVSLLKEREVAGVHGAVDMTIWHPLDTLLASHVPNSFHRFTLIALEEEFDVPNDAAAVIKQSFPKLEEANVINVQMSNALQGFFCHTEDEDLLVKTKVY